MQATARDAVEIIPGALGSEVISNRVPPHRIGNLKLVSGILAFASPRFGTRIANSIPTIIAISGAMAAASDEDSIMERPPACSLHVLSRSG